MSGKTVARMMLVILAGILLGASVWRALTPHSTLRPLPPPPLILADSGALPAGHVAFEERLLVGSLYVRVGSGFLLELPDRNVIGVTTAHSVMAREPVPLQFTLPGRELPIATFSQLHVPRGSG